MQDIKSLSLEELKKNLKEDNFAEFHASQIFNWIYKKDVVDFSLMTDLSKDLRDFLSKRFYILNFKLVKRLVSPDKTEKFLFRLADGALMEAVVIPTEKRATACVSSQVGCKFSCRFCASGIFGFKRNLTKEEILEQVLQLKISYGRITHIVFMGIGEPLDNYDNVLGAIRFITAPFGFDVAARRITISSCGIIPQIKRLKEENLQIELSVSLHAGKDTTRSFLMPINKRYPLKDLISACREYIKETKRQLTFEYILIKDINSSLEEARDLVKILKPLKLVKVNLIVFNPVENIELKPPTKLEVLLFRDFLLKNKINVTLRRARGADIQAGCGQLRLRYEKK